MLRSLFTGIAGLTAHQQMLDVTANNIANVNTTGFKASSVVFQDTLSQTLSGAGAASATVGGTNSKQIGLGVKMAGTELDMSQGGNQATGVGTHLMINGDGYFMINKDGAQLYTRAGAFHLDESGHLTTSDGAIVEDPTGAALDLSALTSGTYVSYSIDDSGAVNAVDAAGNTTTIGHVGIATFANPNGLEKVGDSAYQASASSGAAQMGAANSGPRGSISAGYLEMSNVDLSAQLTNLIISERGFQANSKVITTADQILQTLVNLKS